MQEASRQTQLNQFGDELSKTAQRLYHVRERMQSMVDRLIGPQPQDGEGNYDKAEAPEHCHTNYLRKSLHRLNDEIEWMENLMNNLEEIA